METIKVRKVGKVAQCNSRSVCILGMHRSGTSAVARAMNLLGVYLGEDSKMMPPTADNPGGYWEHLEIHDLQVRLMSRMEQGWDIAEPLPAEWYHSEVIRRFKDELARLVADNFNGHEVWGWKEPRSCLLLPLWREVLADTETELSCVFVVRNPVEVANSLMRRDGIPFDRALGIWFHYNIVALKAAAGLPIVFLGYDRLLADWELEMGRCVTALRLDWRERDEYREAMNSFLSASLRTHRSSSEQLQELPYPVRELYQILQEASFQPSLYGNEHEETINRLSRDFHVYASLLSADGRPLTRVNLLERTINRLANDLDDYLSCFPEDAARPGRRMALAWSTGKGSRLEHLKFPFSNRPPPKFLHGLLGEKLCRSICKRLAKICCWLYP
jgi:hypothetical protein